MTKKQKFYALAVLFTLVLGICVVRLVQTVGLLKIAEGRYNRHYALTMHNDTAWTLQELCRTRWLHRRAWTLSMCLCHSQSRRLLAWWFPFQTLIRFGTTRFGLDKPCASSNYRHRRCVDRPDTFVLHPAG